jgi:hypothetical protein
MDYFVFDPDDFRKSFQLSRLLENFVGIIATAGVISVGYNSLRGEPVSAGEALSDGVSAWGRMWLTRFVTGVSLVVGFICLIIPGIYLLVRLAIVEPIAVCEHIYGPAAMRRSFELTKGRFWTVFLLGVVVVCVTIATLACIILPFVLIPSLDHWLIDAGTSLIADLIGAFTTLVVFCVYARFSEAQSAAESDLLTTPAMVTERTTYGRSGD